MSRALPILIATAILVATPLTLRADAGRQVPIGHAGPAPEPPGAPNDLPAEPDGAWELLPTRHPPRGVGVAATIRDGERGRMLFLTPHVIWSLDLADGLWQPVPVGGPVRGAPAGVAVFDSARDAIFVFGGPVPRSVGELWRLDLERGSTWEQLHDYGQRVPSARRGAVAAIDPDARSVVLFGGHDGSRWLDETWVLDLNGPPTWTRLDFTGATPGPRAAHRMIFDRTRNRAVLLADPIGGGATEVWTLTRSGTPTWSRLQVLGTPPETVGPAVVDYDPVRDWIWVDGGGALMTVEVKALSLANPPEWTVQGAVLRRWSHGGAYDPLHQGLLLALGTSDPDEEEIYDYPGGRVEIRGPGNPYVPFRPALTSEPLEHAGPIAFFDPGRRAIRATQGFEWLTRFYSENAHEYRYSFPRPNDRAYELSTTPLLHWQAFETAAEAPGLAGMAWAHDTRRHRIVAFGGTSGCGPSFCARSPGTWELDLASTPPKWRLLAVEGNSPPARIEAAAVYDSARDRMLMIGGHASYNFWWGQLTDRMVWSFDPTTNSWSSLVTTAPPEFERRVTAVLDPVADRLVLFSPEYYGGLWELALATGEWKVLRTGWLEWGSGRHFDSQDPCALDPVENRLLIYNLASNEVGALELSPPYAWRWLQVSGPPPAATPFRRLVHDPDNDAFWLLGGSPPTAASVLRLRRAAPAPEVHATTRARAEAEARTANSVEFGAWLDPAARSIRLELRGIRDDKPGRFELFDVHGRCLRRTAVAGNSPEVRRAVIQTDGLRPGVYLLRAVVSGRAWTRRIVLLH